MIRTYICLALLLNLFTSYCLNAQAIIKETKDYYLESHLPIIVIDNGGEEIPNEPRDIATMKVFNNGANNSTNDAITEYNGKISIKTRGQSSLHFFPKLSYTIETQTVSGTNNNVSLLGLPKENDWVLQAPYSDKTLMRNTLTYHFANKTGRWSPRTKYCELIVNDEYQGVYVLTEKIKRDKNRVDIAKLNPDENAGDSLTGGYIIKFDKIKEDEDNDNCRWWWDNDGKPMHISYHYPEPGKITSQQKTYIQNEINQLGDVFTSKDFNDLTTGYRKYIKVKSFVDYFLLNEFTKNVDAYIWSSYLYKDKDSKDGRFVMGPFWDHNLAYGNNTFRDCWITEDWINQELAERERPLWVNRLLEDKYYQSDVKERWLEIRSDWLNDAYISEYMDSIITLLGPALDRNFDKWPIIGENVWPEGAYTGESYNEDVQFMKSWMSDRFEWMDWEINKFKILEFTSTNSIEHTVSNGTLLSKAYPNPFEQEFFIQIYTEQTESLVVELYNTTGHLVYNKHFKTNSGNTIFTIHANEINLSSGVVFYRLMTSDGKTSTGKILKK